MNPRQTRDAGFTLPEMLIAIVLMVTLSTVMATTITVALRNLPSTSARADSSVLVQGLTTWLPPDVDSTQPDGFFTDPSTASGCAGTDPGINMLTLRWNETFRGTSTDYTASYRFVDEGDKAYITRLHCENGGAPEAATMTGPLASIPPTVTATPYDVSNTEDDYVVIKLYSKAGEEITIEAASKNPDDDLPYPPPPPPLVPPNAAPYAGYLTVYVQPQSAAPGPLLITFPAGDTDGDPVTVNTIPATVPPELDVIVSGLDFTVEVIDPLVLPGSTFSFDFEVFDVPAGEWASGTIFVDVVAVATPPGPPTYTPPPCQVTAPTINPNPVKLKNAGTGKLKRDVDVSISVLGGYCIGLYLAYDTGGPNGEVFQNFGTSAPYVITLFGHPHSSELWTSGPHVLSVKDGTGSVLSQATLNVVDP